MRLQKGMFLLARSETLPPREQYRFKPYDYGPMSSGIYRDLDELVDEGLLTKRTPTWPSTRSSSDQADAGAERSSRRRSALALRGSGLDVVTILAAVRSRGALVIGSGSEERSAGIPRHTTKILCPQPNLVLAWAGYKDVAQAMALGLQEDPVDLRLPRSKLAGIARERFKKVRSDPDVEHRGDLNDFMLGWYCESERKPVGLHLPGRGSALWIEHWHYAGSPSAVATALSAARGARRLSSRRQLRDHPVQPLWWFKTGL